ncbi:hypothetical protein, partial [Candidatus Hakubella thermalkaliphila]|uniref:hypothetical protein n=1 Tax=Candidatus Hakubella thermalkaliphila TaxID=2754717 RepID=UPI001C612BD7
LLSLVLHVTHLILAYVFLIRARGSVVCHFSLIKLATISSQESMLSTVLVKFVSFWAKSAIRLSLRGCPKTKGILHKVGNYSYMRSDFEVNVGSFMRN